MRWGFDVQFYICEIRVSIFSIFPDSWYEISEVQKLEDAGAIVLYQRKGEYVDISPYNIEEIYIWHPCPWKDEKYNKKDIENKT